MASKFTERTRRFINKCPGRIPDVRSADVKLKRQERLRKHREIQFETKTPLRCGFTNVNIVVILLNIGVIAQEKNKRRKSWEENRKKSRTYW